MKESERKQKMEIKAIKDECEEKLKEKDRVIKRHKYQKILNGILEAFALGMVCSFSK